MSEKENLNTDSDFTPDSPVEEPEKDLFNRLPFAQRIAQALVSRSDPSSIVIGIYGKWGEGKTSVLNFIEHELKKHKQIACVKFNPWRFVDENTLIISFFKTIADAIGKSLYAIWKRIGKHLIDYSEILCLLSIPVINVSPGKAVSQLGKKISSVTPEKLRDRIQKFLKKQGKRVVVLIDDIDRLDKSEIQAVFKLVKLSADFENTAYIMAFDEKMVAAALNDKYPSPDQDAGRNFLEKIVQVPLHLPKADEVSLRELCFQGVDRALNDSQIKLTDYQVQDFGLNFRNGFRSRLTTPRMCKRYTNALSFAFPILKGEVHPVDLMLSEGIRIFYPELYEKIRDNKEIFINPGSSSKIDNNKEKAKQFVDEFLKETTNDEVESVKEILKYLFPKFAGIETNAYFISGWEDTWNKEQRVASGSYFNRYFSYSVPEGDISDIEIKQFLSDISSKSIDDIISSLRGLVNRRNADKVVSKLRAIENNLPEEESYKLSMSIAPCGSIFPDPDQVFGFTAWSQAAIFIHKLLSNIPKGSKRLEAAKAVLSKAAPLSFAVECFAFMRRSDDYPESKQEFSKSDDQILGALIVERIKEESNKGNIYLKYGKKSPTMLWVWDKWSNKKGEVSEYLRETFKKDRHNVIEFLETFPRMAMEVETGINRPGDFRQEKYDSVAELINPDIIYEELKQIFGDEIQKAEDIHIHMDEEIDKRVAIQFAAIYNSIKKGAHKKLSED